MLRELHLIETDPRKALVDGDVCGDNLVVVDEPYEDLADQLARRNILWRPLLESKRVRAGKQNADEEEGREEVAHGCQATFFFCCLKGFLYLFESFSIPQEWRCLCRAP